MDLVLAFLANSAATIVAGIFGGIMRWALYRTHLWDLALNMFVGGTLAYFVSPTLAFYAAGPMSSFTTDIPNIQRLSAFLTGTVGIAAIGLFIDWTRARAKHIISGDVPPVKGE